MFKPLHPQQSIPALMAVIARRFGLGSLIGLGLIAQPVGAQTEVPVEVVFHRMHRTGAGALVVVGEVRNTHSHPLCFVQIDMQYLDNQGKPVGVERFTAKEAGTMVTDQVMASRGVILPGETSPFSRTRDMSKIQGQVRSVKVNAKGLRLRGSSNSAATITHVQIEREGQNFRIQGIYHATGRAPNKNPEVIAAGYDQRGQIQTVTTLALTRDGTFRGQPLTELAPGQKQTFDFRLRNETGNVTQVKVFPSFACE